MGGVGLKGYRRYFGNKLIWFVVTLVAAFILNFTLPRLMPGDPVAAIVARQAQGMSNTSGVQAIYEQYTELFGTNKPMPEQFVIYVQKCAAGRFWFFVQPISAHGGRRDQRLHYVDDCPPTAGDPRRLDNRQHARRAGRLSQGLVRLRS